MQKLLTRSALPTVAQYIPPWVSSAVPTTYLGMPPLPIGGMQKSVTTGLRGISSGRVAVVAEPNRPTDVTGRRKGRSGGVTRKASKRTRNKPTPASNTNEPTKPRRKKAGKISGKKTGTRTKRRGRGVAVLSRNNKGRFTKK